MVVFSIGDAGYNIWTTASQSQLQQLGLGASQMAGLQAGEPFVFFGRKGATPGSAQMFRPSAAPANAQQVTVNKTITGRFTKGSMTSVIIGPAVQWAQFSSQLTGATTNDVFGVNVKGVNLLGEETLLKSQLTGSQTLADIDASVYPYLKLVLQTRDSIDLTPVQLRRWQVTFVPMAEGMLTYGGSVQPVFLQEGEEWSSTYGFTNISNRTFLDSLTVTLDVFSTDKQAIEHQAFRIKPPAPGDTTKFAVGVNSRGKGGSNDVTVFVNPRILPEPYFDNNILSFYGHLQVEEDRTGPVLDVTIDGRRVVNGDIVASSPEILTRVIDRNPFLLKVDTVGVDLFLQSPCADVEDCPYTRINFSQPDVSWRPATATEEFQVMYQPANLAVGEYVLKVNAVDANGNLSGDVPYEVSFRVKDGTSFALESVYPNPASEFFYFKFVVQGKANPEDFFLELFSSTGNPVRSFGNKALEVMHVGTNELSIQARDSSGELLPVGIYLFRLGVTVEGVRFTESGRMMVVR